MSGERFVLAIDQGTTSTRAILFDREGACAQARKCRLRNLSGAGRGRARPGRDLAVGAACGPRRAPQHRALKRRGYRHHQSARDDGGVGASDREAARQRDRLAGPPHRRSLRRASQRGVGRSCRPNDRTGDRSLFLRDQARLAPATCARSRGTGARGRGLLRHGRQLSPVQDDRRQAACDGRDQRRPHHALRHRSGCWDDKLIGRLGVPRAMLPEPRDTQGDFGATELEHFGAAIPIRAMAGDQQAAAYGQACFAPGMLKATYGTGCFVLANTGREKVASATRMLVDDLPSDRGASDLCARRRDLHGRRHGAVA